MDFDEIAHRAHAGALTADDLRDIDEWLRNDAPPEALIAFVQGVEWDVSRESEVRRLAVTAGGERLRQQQDALMLYELIRISESDDERDTPVRDAAIRALAKATEYRGRRVELSLDL